MGGERKVKKVLGENTGSVLNTSAGGHSQKFVTKSWPKTEISVKKGKTKSAYSTPSGNEENSATVEQIPKSGQRKLTPRPSSNFSLLYRDDGTRKTSRTKTSKIALLTAIPSSPVCTLSLSSSPLCLHPDPKRPNLDFYDNDLSTCEVTPLYPSCKPLHSSVNLPQTTVERPEFVNLLTSRLISLPFYFAGVRSKAMEIVEKCTPLLPLTVENAKDICCILETEKILPAQYLEFLSFLSDPQTPDTTSDISCFVSLNERSSLRWGEQMVAADFFEMCSVLVAIGLIDGPYHLEGIKNSSWGGTVTLLKTVNYVTLRTGIIFT
eukprot:CFRG0083T1